MGPLDKDKNIGTYYYVVPLSEPRPKGKVQGRDGTDDPLGEFRLMKKNINANVRILNKIKQISVDVC